MPRKLPRALVGMVFIATLAGTADGAPKEAYHPATLGEMIANQSRWILTGQDAAQSPPGVNVAGCRPSAAHPYPVVLVHGLNGNQYNGWAYIGPTLANLGYCVYALNYGGTSAFNGGTAPIADSAAQIGQFVDGVRASTGADKVDLVGHSEGGFLVEYVPKLVPGMASKVHAVVAMSAPTHGTTLFGAVTIADILGLRPVVGWACAACSDLIAGGGAVQALTNGPIAQPGIAYTTIISTHDEAITPASTAAIQEPGVHNRLVQDVCPYDPVGHTGMAYDRGVVTMVTNALDPSNPAPIVCDVGSPL